MTKELKEILEWVHIRDCDDKKDKKKCDKRLNRAIEEIEANYIPIKGVMDVIKEHSPRSESWCHKFYNDGIVVRPNCKHNLSQENKNYEV